MSNSSVWVGAFGIWAERFDYNGFLEFIVTGI